MTKTDTSNASARKFEPKIERQISLTHAVLTWEQLWPAVWPALGFVALFFGLSFLGLWAFLPGLLHIAVLTVLAVATFLSLWFGLRRITRPEREDVVRRLETANALGHRALSSLHDRMAPVSVDTATDALWREHKKRQARLIHQIKSPLPKSYLPERDPFALRFAAILLLVAAGVIGFGDWQHRLMLAVTPTTKAANIQLTRVDAWVTPPTYTDTPPLFLTEDGSVVSELQNGTIVVPRGSIFAVKVSGTNQSPILSVTGLAEDPELNATSDNVFEAAFDLTASARVSVRQGLFSVANWSIEVSPDNPPEVALTGKAVPDQRQAINVPYKATDDYGIGSVSLELSLKNPEAGVATYYGTDLSVELSPLASDPKDIKSVAKENLTEHPWAGLDAQLTIKATDESGQIGQSVPVDFTMPERIFKKPLAAAVVEQRKNLAHRTMPARKVAQYLDALTIAPDETYFSDTKVYLGIRAAYWRLQRITDFTEQRALAAKNTSSLYTDDVLEDFDTKIEDLTKSTVKMLWDIALKIEDGDKSLAEQELLAAQEALMDALADGASDEEVAELVENLKQALDRYLEALATQALEEFQRTGKAPATNDPDALIEMEDLDDLLESIEELAETGARESARQLLSQLQDLLQNLKAGDFAPGLTQSQQAMQNALGELGDMIGDLRGVMDETFRQDQAGPTPPSNESNGSGQSLEGLANDQRAVGEDLQKLLQQLGENGTEIPSTLGQADRSIERGATALDSGETGRALDQQGRAIDQLRQGAQELAQQLLDELQNNGSGVGQGKQRGRGKDPLGRPNANGGPDFGDSVKVPNERAIQRARDILKELQRRASDKSRPTPELEYLERLLKRF